MQFPDKKVSLKASSFSRAVTKGKNGKHYNYDGRNTERKNFYIGYWPK